jgi:hypothetical protein
MKAKDVHIGETYEVKVSGKIQPVRITAESPYGGWVGINTETGREVRFRTAGRLRINITVRDAVYHYYRQGCPEGGSGLGRPVTTGDFPSADLGARIGKRDAALQADLDRMIAEGKA